MKYIITSLLMLCCVAAGAYDYKLFGEIYSYSNSYKDSNSTITYAMRTDEYDGSPYAVALSRTSTDGVMRFAESLTYQGKTYSVKAVADFAFDQYKYVQILNTGNSMVSIGRGSFQACNNLRKVVLGSNIKFIGSYAFNSCININELQMGPNIISINSYAFTGCQIPYLELPSTITEIGTSAFWGNNSLKLIDWNLDPEKISAEDIINNKVFEPIITSKVIVHTKTLKQAEEARKIFTHVYCEEENGNTDALTYYKGLFNMKVTDDNKVLGHYKVLSDCDVNQDGAINAADVVTIYNRIINGSSNMHNGYEYVDMGFPGDNNVLWATCNIGASTPECVGDYFAWGDNVLLSYQTGTLFKKYGFTQANYTPPTPIKEITTDLLPTVYQPTVTRMGGKWRMPTGADIITLALGSTRQEVTINGVKCIEYKSKYNGNKLYIPIAGMIDGLEIGSKNEAWYWTSEAAVQNQAMATRFNGFEFPFADRYIGMPIRAVVSKKDVEQ